MTKVEAARFLFLSQAVVDELLRSGDLASLERPVVRAYRRGLRAQQKRALKSRSVTVTTTESGVGKGEG